MKNKNLIIGLVVTLVLVIGGVLVYVTLNNPDNGQLVIPSADELAVVALVEGKEITNSDVFAMQEIAAFQGVQLSDQQALEELINQEILYQQAEKMGLALTNKEIEETLNFQLLQQGLDLEQFKQEIESQGMSYDKELKIFAKQTAIENYLDAVLAEQTFEVSQEEAMDFYQLHSQQSLEELPQYEELESEIIQIIKYQKQQEAVANLLVELRKNTTITYY